MNCSNCGVNASLSGAKFCEECGTPFELEAPVDSPAPAASTGCSNCGAPESSFDSMGFCSQCGLERVKLTIPPHWECALSPRLAGVCDVGLKHPENEDFMAMGEVAGVRVAVICDGISQSCNAADAASLAARIVSKSLLDAAEKTPDLAMDSAMRLALAEAQKEVTQLAGHLLPDSDDSPATTIIVACVRGPEIVLGWLGDCRAYWFGTENRLLTKDHSWINEVVDSGTLTYQEAQKRRGAHAVTRSLGGPSFSDENPDEASIIKVMLSAPGWLLLCSDGLWGYAPEPAEMAAWIKEASTSQTEALPIARALVEKGRDCGGKDNLTALLIGL